MEADRVRRRLSAEERRAGILRAALAVFSERGFHVTAIDDVARAAGISKALIFERLGTALEHLEADSGADRLAAGLDAFFAFVEERPDAWRILFRDMSDPETAAALDRVVEQVTAVVAALIAQDPGARAIEAERAEQERAIRMLAQMLVGAVQSLVNGWADHREVPRAQLVEMVMDFAWLGLERLRGGERWPRPR